MKSPVQKIIYQADEAYQSVRHGADQLERIEQDIIFSRRDLIAKEVASMRSRLIHHGVPAGDTPILAAEYMRHLMADMRKADS